MVDMLEQGRLLRAAADSLVAVAPQGWQRLLYRFIEIGQIQRTGLQVWTPQGHSWLTEGPSTTAIMKDLRAQMYQSGRGTWFTADLEILAENGGSLKTAFIYDHEPQLDIDTSEYERDLAAFPRDDDKQPEWLRVRLARTGVAPSEPTVDAALEAYGRELFGRLPGGGGQLNAVPLPRGLGVCVVQSFRGGGKLYIAPDRSAMFSPSAESFEKGLAAFEGGERSREDQLPKA